FAPLRAGAGGGGERRVARGRRKKAARDLLVHRRGGEPERLDARLLGRESWIGRVDAERVVHLPGDLAQPDEPVEEPLGRRRDLVECERPAVDPVGYELLQQAERRGQRPTRAPVPAAERRDVAE